MPRSTPSRVRRTVAALGVTTLFATTGVVFSAYRATTTNPGNDLQTGTVAISDNDGGSTALYTAALDGNLAPGQSVVKCIAVTYTGTLPSTVKLYSNGAVTNGAAFDLVVERGSGLSGSFPSCTGFVSGGSAYTGTLGAVPTTYAAGISTKSLDASWTTSDVVAFRFTLTAKDDTTPDARRAVTTTSTHTFTWEARNA